jgi:hypothetical protein
MNVQGEGQCTHGLVHMRCDSWLRRLCSHDHQREMLNVVVLATNTEGFHLPYNALNAKALSDLSDNFIFG